MRTHNLATPAGLEITVSGVNFSLAAKELTGAYAQYSEGGILTISGQLILADYPGLAYTLDDRRTSMFDIGRIVTAKFAGEFAPIVGRLYIVDNKYAEANNQQTLGLTCALGLANNISPEELGVCLKIDLDVDGRVVLGVGTGPNTVAQAIAELFARLGFNFNAGEIGGIPGKIYESENLGLGQSLVQFCGQMAADNGYYLWQDRTGQIRASKIADFDAEPNVYAGEVITLPVYERLNPPGLPPDIVQADGELTQLLQPLPLESDHKVVEPVTTGAKVTTTKSYRRPIKRELENRSWIELPMGEINPQQYKGSGILRLAEYSITITDHELPTAKIGKSLNECIPADPGRMLIETQRVMQHVDLLFREYFKIQAESIKASTSAKARYNLLSQTPDATQVILNTYALKLYSKSTWAYNTPKPKRILQNTANTLNTAPHYTVKHVYQEWSALGSVWPTIGNIRLGRKLGYNFTDFAYLDSTISLSPNDEVQTKEVIETWVRNVDERTWFYEYYERGIAATVAPEAIQAMIDDSSIALATLYDYATSLVFVKRETELYAKSPGSGGTWSPDIRTESIPYTRRFQFSTSNPLAKNLHVNLGKYTANVGTADTIAMALAKIAWARHHGQNYGFGLGYLSTYDLRPFSRVTVTDASGTVSAYACDGPSIVIRQKESVIQSDALWLRDIDLDGTVHQPATIAPIVSGEVLDGEYHLATVANQDAIVSVNAGLDGEVNFGQALYLIFVTVTGEYLLLVNSQAIRILVGESPSP